MQRVPLTGNYGTVAMIRPVLGLMTAADPQSAKTNPRSAPRTIPRAMTRKEIVVEATGLSGAYVVSEANRLVEAAGIEPLFLINPNPMMANDFGFFPVKIIALPRRFDSPGVPSSPLESSPVLEK
jgi:hypothetical protein